jgi:hypothetical protein
MADILRLTREIIDRQKPWLRRPSDVSVDDLPMILRAVYEGTCPPPDSIEMSLDTERTMEFARADQGPNQWQGPGVALNRDEDVPLGRVHISWPDPTDVSPS